MIYGADFQVMPHVGSQAEPAIGETIVLLANFRNEPVRILLSIEALGRLFRLTFPFAEWKDVSPDDRLEVLLDLMAALPRAALGSYDLGRDVSIIGIETQATMVGSIAFIVRSSGFVFPVLVDVPDKLLAILTSLATNWPRELDPAKTRHSLRFCFGYAIVSKDEFRDAEPGDVIEIDGPFRVVKALSVILGETHVAANPPLDKKFSFSSFRKILGNDFRRLLMDNSEDEVDDVIEIEDVGSLKLTLVFEAGRKIVSLAELESMSPGDLLQLERPDETVDILVGRQKIGEGEIVELDRGFGVRILKMAGP